MARQKPALKEKRTHAKGQLTVFGSDLYAENYVDEEPASDTWGNRIKIAQCTRSVYRGHGSPQIKNWPENADHLARCWNFHWLLVCTVQELLDAAKGELSEAEKAEVVARAEQVMKDVAE